MTATCSRLASTLLAGHTLCLFVTVPAIAQTPQPPAPRPPAALVAYVERRFDEAMTAVGRMSREEMSALGPWLLTAARPWIAEAPPEARARRQLAVAAFALEAEWVRAESGDYAPGSATMNVRDKGREVVCEGLCAIEAACALLQERGARDDAERTWMLASVAFAGTVREWRLLQSPLTMPRPRTREQGHAHHAMARFPQESRFRLARAVAIASRFAVLTEMPAPRAGVRTDPATSRTSVVVVAPFPGGADDFDERRPPLDYARQQFADLLADPIVGVEARMRLGYLDLRARDYEQALARERDVVAATGADPDVRYIAAYIGAQAAQALGDLAGAEALYASALDVRPRSQSATLGLAALKFQRGDVEPAYALIEESLRDRRQDDDPWRLFLYGDGTRLPALLKQLRADVAR